jgi:hypothetical protein
MGETERIRDQLIRCIEGPAWHGPALLEVHAGVTADQAAARTVTRGHTLWELVLHITAWQDAAVDYVTGKAADLSERKEYPCARPHRLSPRAAIPRPIPRTPLRSRLARNPACNRIPACGRCASGRAGGGRLAPRGMTRIHRGRPATSLRRFEIAILGRPSRQPVYASGSWRSIFG